MSKLQILIYTLFLILTAQAVKSQDESFFGLTLGTAIPQGDYAKKEFTNEQAGYANTGFLFTFDAAFFPDDYLGFGATVTYGSNNPDKKKYKEDLINDVIARYPSVADFKDSIYFDYGVWRYLNIHVGPNLTFAAGQFNFDLRALAGLSLAWPPNQLFQVKNGSEQRFSRMVSPKAVPTLGYTVGGGIRYALKSGYVFRIIAEYSNCKPTIEIREDVIEDLITGNEVPSKKIAMPIKNIQLGIGIAYNFEL